MLLSLRRLTTGLTVIGISILAACANAERPGYEQTGGGPTPAPGPADGFGTPGDGKPGPRTPCEQASASKGYAGCDFRVAPTPVKGMIGDAAPCYAAFVTNVSSKATPIRVSLGAQTFDATKFGRTPNGATDPAKWTPLDAGGLAPGQMAVLFLSHDPAAQSVNLDDVFCPVKPAVEESSGRPILSAGRAKTFRIQTDEPVVAYDIMPFGGARSFAPSAQILLPTSAWGKNYVGVLPPFEPFRIGDPPGQGAWMMVAAHEDGTTVEVGTGPAAFEGTGGDAVPSNAKKTISLGAGEYVLWTTPRTGAGDASGTVFTSNKPVSLTTGDIWTGVASATSQRDTAKMPDGTPLGAPQFCCMDGSHQMIPPVSGLGSEYVGAPYPTRLASLQEESIRYRIVGYVDGTKLSFDPPIAGVPGQIGLASVVDFEAKGAFRVKSQDDKHPFYVAQLMTYASTEGGTRQDGTEGVFKTKTPLPLSLGDPEFVSMLPAGQFLTEYTFLTDPTYATGSLVVTRARGDKGFADVELECLGGTITGWQPVGSSGDYQFARVDLVRRSVANANCATSSHKAKSEGKFAIQVWGVDWWASYSYPAGGSVAKLNDVVVAPR